ncbi:MAG: radical SAM protein [Theionarchaea archaeon]|nr:radical SAM protein [Theionarchaea archaeon]
MIFLLMSAHRWDPPSPPAALDYVAWELEKIGIDSEIADISFMDIEELESLLQSNQYDGVCVTIRNLERTAFSEKLHFPLPAIKKLVQLVKTYCSGPIIVGGNGFSIMPERILDYLGADYGIHGGGEDSLPLLIKYLFENEGDPGKIPHLVYRQNSSGKKSIIKRNLMSPYKRKLPAVKRGYVNYCRYFRPGYENFSRFGNIETKRGCPYHCMYCVEPEIKGRKVRVKSPEDVTQEVDWFLRKGITCFFLTDSEFNADCEAAVALLQYWRKRGYHRKIQWLTYATPAHFSEELAALLPQSGNLGIAIDFGHISNKMLANLGKSYTKSDIEEALHLGEQYGLTFKGSLILGGPEETRETIREAIEFFHGVVCEITIALGIRVFPNTPFGERIRKSGSLVDNPNLYGKVIDNDDLLEPVYYISQELGEDIFDYLSDIIPNPQQFYTLASPFKVQSVINGHFRGVIPEYKTAGALQMQYITPAKEKDASLSSRK